MTSVDTTVADQVLKPRRLRASAGLRDLVRETFLAPSQLIYPLFAVPGRDVRTPVQSMPGVFQLSVEHLAEEAHQAAALGVRAVLLFGIPESKDAVGSGSGAALSTGPPPAA